MLNELHYQIQTERYEGLKISIYGSAIGYSGKKGKANKILKDYKPRDFFKYDDQEDKEDEAEAIDEIIEMEKLLGGVPKNG